MAEKFLYLTTTGRKTSNLHKIEIWYVDYDDCYVLCAEHREKSDWVKNVQANPDVEFYVAERDEDVPVLDGVADIITEQTDINAIAPLFDAKYNWSDGLFVRICPKS